MSFDSCEEEVEKQVSPFDFLPFSNISLSLVVSVTCLLTADYWPFVSRPLMETLSMGVSALWQGVEL